MDNLYVQFFAAAAAGILLQLLIRLSSRIGSKKGRLAVNIGKCTVLLGIQLLLIYIFSFYGNELSGHSGCIAASCVTCMIAASVHLMQYFSDRKYPMTEAQRMLLNEL